MQERTLNKCETNVLRLEQGTGDTRTTGNKN